MERKALLPVGYECNNLFLTDWDETDFGSWTFMICSMFLSAGISSENPVAEWKNAGNSIAYGIPSKEFESVIQEFLNVKQTFYAKSDLPGER